MQAIPAIDLKDGRTVRLFKGRFDAVSEYDFSPEDLVRQYLDLGVEWVHVVDLDGARSGSGGNREVIGRMAEIAEGRIQVGGGIRTRKDVDELVGLGAGRVVVGSAAAENAKEVLQWIDALGPEKVVLAFDVRINVVGLPIVLTRGWTRGDGRAEYAAVCGRRRAFPRHSGPGIRRSASPGGPGGAARHGGDGRDHRQGPAGRPHHPR